MAKDFVSTVLTNVKNLLVSESDLLRFLCPEMEKLESYLSDTEAVLEDAEWKQLTESSFVVSDWLQKLMDAVYQLDDVLDECSIEALRDEYEGERSCAFLSFLHPEKVLFQRSISGRMRAISEELNSIHREKDRFAFHLEAATERQTNRHSLERCLTIAAVTENFVYGREHEKEQIVHMLLVDGSEVNDLKVLPIVGMGGIGKTTLAKSVYNDERVNKHFDKKIWIGVSENFDLVGLMKSILRSAAGTKFAYENYSLDVLFKKLRDVLEGRRYLLVLDDVWNEHRDKWLRLRRSLACGSKGSAVLVTTRSQSVAAIMCTPDMPPCLLDTLSLGDCWEVLKRYAFRFQMEQPVDLFPIGKDLANKCRGIALSAKIIGSLLSFNSGKRWWLHVRDNDLWTKEEEDYAFGGLKLSYLGLSPRLRRCFAYLAIFPKDYTIEKEDLIHLWIANEFISC